MDGQDIILHHIGKKTWIISEDGTIRNSSTGREIATNPTSSSGYLQVGMVDPDTKRNFTTNKQRVIWIFFRGRIPDGHVINHIDGNKTNNAIANLECITQRENVKHAAQTGMLNHGRQVKRNTYVEDLQLIAIDLNSQNKQLRSKITQLEEKIIEMEAEIRRFKSTDEGI